MAQKRALFTIDNDEGDEIGDLGEPTAGGGKQGAAHGDIPP
jgi:hypothetical protein